jgi:hypothetical protein
MNCAVQPPRRTPRTASVAPRAAAVFTHLLLAAASRAKPHSTANCGLDVPVVADEAELAEFVHEMANAASTSDSRQSATAYFRPFFRRRL